MNDSHFLRCLESIEQSKNVDSAIQTAIRLISDFELPLVFSRFNPDAEPTNLRTIIVDTNSSPWAYRYTYSDSSKNTDFTQYLLEKCRQSPDFCALKSGDTQNFIDSGSADALQSQSVFLVTMSVEIGGALSMLLHYHLTGFNHDPMQTRCLFAMADRLNKRIQIHYRQHRADAIGLTRREIECLEWVSLGKSDWEIGRILELSRKTVNLYIERSKKKLDVSTRIQAVVLAIQMGILFSGKSSKEAFGSIKLEG